MERITKKQVEGIFQIYLKTTGRKPLADYKDVGGWFLDYYGIGGGFVVCQMMEHGGERHPMGDMRRTAREMWDCLHFALRAHEDNQPRCADLVKAAESSLEWARTPGEHGGNPYLHQFIKDARQALGDC